MAGQPQVREAGWLYGADPGIQLVHVRLEEQADGSWDLYVSDPASAASQHARFADQDSARAELQRAYDWYAADGVWRVDRPEPY